MLAPREIHLHRGSRTLELVYDDGLDRRIPCELLRVWSPSAEVRGHGGSRPPPVSGKQEVNVTKLEPAGNYGIRLIFDDGHDTGIFSWAYLRDLGDNGERYWRLYLAELAKHNLSRLVPIPGLQQRSHG